MQDQRTDIDGKKVWIMAGEESGDIYGADLACELKTLAPTVHISGMGGREMKQAGIEIIVDSTELGVVGLVEVLKHYGTFRRIFSYLVRQAREQRPDLIIFIDYPGFNLRFAEKMHKLDIPMVYYISPQVWAWGKRRIAKIARCMSRMLVIFPFEEHIYQSVGLDTVFVGHPLLDIMRKHVAAPPARDDTLIVLLPGSRFSEVDRLFEPMYQTADRLHEQDSRYRFVVAVPRAAVAERIAAIRTRLESGGQPGFDMEIRVGETEQWMQTAVAGIAASGTVTIQSAILRLPIIVIYKVNALTCMILRALTDIRYITMVNLIARKRVYEEFLQGDAAPCRMLPALTRILPGGDRRRFVLDEIAEVARRLETGGSAGRRAAREVYEVLQTGAA